VKKLVVLVEPAGFLVDVLDYAQPAGAGRVESPE